MPRVRFSAFTVVAVLVAALWGGATRADAGSIFLTGHDPDFHAVIGNTVGAQNINIAAISFIMDPLYNPYSALPFIFVQSSIAPPGGHIDGELGIIASGYTAGVDYVEHNAATLDAALDGLGTTYGGIVIASDFGGILTQAELDILNARSGDILDFLNSGGGLYAMAEGNSGAGLTPGGGWFGFLPFIVSSTALNQAEAGNTLTAFGASLGLLSTDINGNFSHTIFLNTGGMFVVDFNAQGQILSLATRSQIGPGGVVPEPATLLLLGTGLAAAGVRRRMKKRG